MEIYLIVSLLFGGLCYYLAGKRGRREWLWFALGFVGGLIALIVLLVLPDLSKRGGTTAAPAAVAAPAAAPAGHTTPSAAPPASEARMPCPRCGESIAAAAKVCRFCDYELQPST